MGRGQKVCGGLPVTAGGTQNAPKSHFGVCTTRKIAHRAILLAESCQADCYHTITICQYTGLQKMKKYSIYKYDKEATG